MVHFFPNRNRPRSTFDLKVGKFHLLEVTVHLRRRRRRRTAVKKNKNQKKKNKRPKTKAKSKTKTNNSRSKNSTDAEDTINNNSAEDDWLWYDTNKEEIHDEVLELLERSIISRMFATEMEDYYQKYHPTVVPPPDHELEQIGAKNKKKSFQGRGGTKRRGKGGTTTTTTTKKKKTNNNKKRQHNYASFGTNEENEKPEKEIYFAFGERIEVAYKKEPIPKWNESQTVLFKPLAPKTTTASSAAATPKLQTTSLASLVASSSTGRTRNTTTTTVNAAEKAGGPATNEMKTPVPECVRFLDRKKLSSKLCLWISPAQHEQDEHRTNKDTASTTTPALASTVTLDAIYEYRPEMIPISNLFRVPEDIVLSSSSSSSSSDDDDDDDDDA